MSGPPRPPLKTSVRVSPPVALELTRRDAFTALAALHEARAALRALANPSHAGLLSALEAHERELGLAIGPDAARAFLKRRARRRSEAAAGEASDADPTSTARE